MQPLLIDKGLRTSHPDSKVRAIASSLILAALSRIKDPLRKRHIIRFLLDSGLNARPGMMINLSEAGLDGAYLIKIDLHGINLSSTKLQNALLAGADLRVANLHKADLDNAELRGG